MSPLGQFPPPRFVVALKARAFNTGRQVTHLLCRFLIDEMLVSTNGNRHARSTSERSRHGRRPWIPRWAKARNRCAKARCAGAYPRAR